MHRKSHLASTFLLCLGLLSGSCLAAQSILDKRVDFKVEESSIAAALLQLSEVGDFPVVFSSKLLADTDLVSLEVLDTPVENILATLLQNTGICFEVKKGKLMLSKNPARNFVISGYVQDAKTGEGLVLANVWEANSGKGISTNDYGFFSLSLEEGPVDLHFSYLGYQKKVIQQELKQGQRLGVKLTPSLTLQEVVVEDDLRRRAYRSYLPGKGIGIQASDIKAIPNLVGEADLFRLLQLEGDIQTGADGIGGLHVRGGNTDQNLILLDGVPVYNPSHTLGLFSIFNTQIIKSVRLLKDDFSAKYGGRLSSVIDVRTKEGSTEAFSFTGELGVLASKAVVEGPILGKKGAILVSGRRTHLDPLITGISRQEKRRFNDVGETNYSFHDVTAKIHLALSNTDRIYLSFYDGADRYRDRTDWMESFRDTSLTSRFRQKVRWGNTIGSLRWNRIYGDKLFSNTTLTISEFRYRSQNIGFFEEKTPDSLFQSDLYLEFSSKINDIGLKTDFEYFPSDKHHLRFGIGFANRIFNPGSIELEDSELVGDEIDQVDQALDDFTFAESILTDELNVYVEDQMQLAPGAELTLGLHTASFFTTGKNYFSVQPRLGLSWRSATNYTTRFSISRMTQFMHVLTTSGSGFPSDLWVPATGSVKPQHAWQIALSESANFKEKWGGKLELYYKRMSQLISYREGATLPSLSEPNPIFWEEDITSGEGWSYGTALQVQYKDKYWTTSLQTAVAASKRRFGEVNDGLAFPYRYQHPFSLNLQWTYQLSEKILLSASWDYGNGQPITLILSDYPFAPLDNLSATPSERIGGVNEFRMPAYHRLDIAMSINWGKQRWKHQLNLGIYNVYNRANTYFQYWLDDLYYPEENGLQSQLALPVLPSFSYSFGF